MFIVKMADHDGNHRCLIEKNVPIALILPSRWQDGAESLGIEHKLFMVKAHLNFAPKFRTESFKRYKNALQSHYLKRGQSPWHDDVSD